MEHLVVNDCRGPAVAAGNGRMRMRAPRVLVEFALRVFALAVLTLAFTVAVLSPALAEIDATIKAKKDAGFGRMVIEFERLPAYKDELASGILVLSFDEAVKISLEEVALSLPDYISISRQDPDGRAIRFALVRSFKVNIMEAGKKLFVDLMPPSWTGAPPVLPQSVMRELARAAAAAEDKAREESLQLKQVKVPYKVKVRMARHPTFSRIVFEWNKFVTVNLGRQGNQIALTFGQKAPVDLARLKVDPPKFLREVKSKARDPGMEVQLVVDDDVDVRGFREGFSYVVDLTGPEAALDESVAEAAKAVDDKTKEKKTAEKKQEPSTKKKDRKAETKLAGQTGLSEKAGDDFEPAPQPEFQSAVMQFEPGKYRADDYGDWDAIAPVARLMQPEAPGARKPKAKMPQPVAQKKAQATAAKKLSPPAGPQPVAKPASGDETAPVTVQVREAGANLRLVFPFAKPISGAVFRRGRTIWLVFDSNAKLDDAALRDPPGSKVVDVEHVRSGSMQYFRLTLSRPWLSYVAHNRNAWTVDIGDLITGEAEPLHLKRALRQDNQSVIRIELKNPGHVHWLRDSDIGDRIAVVTAFAPPRNVAKPQDFVEFTALPTAHGIAIRPNSNDIGVRQRLDEVIITRHKGLTLSAGYARQYVPGLDSLNKSPRLGFLDFAAWRVQDPGQLSGQLYKLQRAIAISPSEEKMGLRFALARTYLANGLHVESLGVLRQMVDAYPQIINDPSFNIVRAAANVLSGRIAAARKDLEVHALANDQDASLWRGLLQVQDRDWSSTLRSFRGGALRIESYSPDVQVRFRLAAARAALELAKLDRAAEELDALSDKKLPKSFAAEANILKGWYLAKTGRAEMALQLYDAVLKGDVRPAAAEAELRMIALLLKLKKIPEEEAVKKLERLQLIWRGDTIELRTLRLLASLYVKADRYRDAFRVMKNAVPAFPNSKIALQIQDDMKDVFKDLFINGKSDALTPVHALSLYYEHQELTPVGRLGDEMIRRLSDRLISVDLLDQAAELLDHQVRKRLSGAARAQVATRLAVVYMMNRKPDMALRVIRRTRQAGLPNEMRRSRNLLEARALGELGRAEAAIEILNTMEGVEVERLKSDALWMAQSWQKSGEQLEKTLGDRWQTSESLSESERFDVLRAAISYSLANDQFALDRLRKKFYGKMLKTLDSEAFTLVTKPVNTKGIDFRRLAKEIAATDTLDAFMKDFRKRFVDPKSTQSGVSGGKGRAG
ncbi:MAG: tetratricopeptide repeat protein [Methyloligellaceae bacterium]